MRCHSSSEDFGEQRLLSLSGSTLSYEAAFQRRLRVLAGCIVLALGLLLARTWYLQVVRGDYFQHLSDNNRLRSFRTQSLRGKIVDRFGHVLADNRPAYTLMALPELLSLPPPKPLLDLLQTLQVEGDFAALYVSRTASGGEPIALSRDLSRDQVAYFAEHRMDFPGLFIEVEPLRVYPHGALAAHLLGYLGEISEQQLRHNRGQGYYPGDLIGQYGLEKTYEAVLRGRHGLRRVEVDARGRETRLIKTRAPTAGTDLVLSLDLRLQRLAEQLLEGQRGSIVALDPRNGQLLALASSPAFDPNVFAARPSAEEWEALRTDMYSPLHNRALQGQYPPGSVFKIVTALAALAEGVITPQKTVCCSGRHVYGERTYRDWKLSGHGCVQLRQALAQSCDVYFYHIGQQLPIDTIAQYAQAFGLGQTTGFAPGMERSGLVPSVRWKSQARGQPWYTGETLSVAIGQSYTLTTPLQIANMIATLANGGTLYRPYVVLQQIGPDGKVRSTTAPTVRRRLGIQPQQIALVQEGLWGVVHDAKGTGKRAFDEQIDIAGKTGTAQVVDIPNHNGPRRRQDQLPERQRHHAWFVAYAPFEAPRIAVVVMIEHAGKGGGEFAGYAKTLIHAYLQASYPMTAGMLSYEQARATVPPIP